MITDSDYDAIIRTIGTFPMSSPIILDDIYFASRIDGYSLDHIPVQRMAWEVKARCDARDGPYGRRDRKSWYRRW